MNATWQARVLRRWYSGAPISPAVPRPVVTGFTSGIAVIICSGEVKDLLGLRIGEVPAEFFANPQSDRARDFLSKILTH